MDGRPRQAIELARAWARGEITMTQARSDANAAARDVTGAAKEAAHAAAQAAAVAHVAAQRAGSGSSYAIRAVRAASPKDDVTKLVAWCQWQRAKLPEKIRALVLDDKRLRNEVCWFLFNC